MVQHLADAGPHEDGVGQLQAGEEIVDVAVLQHRSPAARAHVEAIAQARLVLDEVLGVARLVRRAGAEEPEQRAAMKSGSRSSVPSSAWRSRSAYRSSMWILQPTRSPMNAMFDPITGPRSMSSAPDREKTNDRNLPSVLLE